MFSFDELTNLYSLSKTLRFELKPIPETKTLLEKVNSHNQTPVQVDQEIDELYHKEIKPLFDNLHEKFILETLETIDFDNNDLKKLEDIYLELQTLLKDRRKNKERIDVLQKRDGEIIKMQEKLRKFICEHFLEQAEKWKKKYSEVELDDTSFKILTNAKILSVLEILYPEKKEAIKKFKGFFTYFHGFNQNRENYYSDEPKASGVANRIVNENLQIFTENRKNFETIKEKVAEVSKYANFLALTNYKNYLTQEGIEDFNENIIGKINSEKNLYLQQEFSKKVSKSEKLYLPNLKKLYKQIGCRTKQQMDLEEKGESIYPKYLDKVGLGFQIEMDEKGEYKIWQALEYLNNELSNKIARLKKGYQDFFTHWNEYDLNEIWFRKEAVNTFSSKWFGGENWYVLTDALKENGIGKIENGEYKTPAFVNLADLKTVMDSLSLYKPENLFKESYRPLFKNSLFETFLSVWQHEIDSKFLQTAEYLKDFEIQSKEPFTRTKKNDKNNKDHTTVVKNLIEDGYLRLLQFSKYHSLEKKGVIDPRPVENRFYDDLANFWEENEIIAYHKAFQATLTKKPFSEDKIKLNFENGSLLGGFSDGQEKNKAGVIVQNGEKMYLGVLRDRTFFRTDRKNILYETNDLSWKRLILTNLKFQTLAGRGFIGKYKTGYGDLGRKSPLEAVRLLQEFIRNNYLQKYPQLNEVTVKKYKDKKDFDADIKRVLIECFTMKFVPISKKVLEKGIEEEKLYLFEITNKDISNKKQTGKSNIHTLYWQELFNDKNLKKPILALNGGAEIFFRKGQKEKLDKKVDKSGKEILSNKRYATDKYFLHVSITINYGKSQNIRFRDIVNEKIKKENNITIIGIDRGEKNLLYYSVIDGTGKIIDQGSLNNINGVDYNQKLQERQNSRNQARLDWQEIGNIKNFKDGYLSQAVNKIYELIIQYNSIVILEDLNAGFKAKRLAKVEKSVYKKFELALAKKLNHLILKNSSASEVGSVLNGYQLTPLISSGDVGKFERAKQWGVLFYVRANYTSTTDPLTGWRKHKTIYISNSETINKIKDFFKPQKNIQISYSQDKKCYVFSYLNDEQKWDLYAYLGLERFYWNNKKREVERFDIYKEFNNLFKDFDKKKNIHEQIWNAENFDWKRLVFLWNLLTQIRNTDNEKIGNENDFIQSPIWSEKHKLFFDSRKITQKELPENGDANGAYNIARKGLMLVKRLKDSSDITNFGDDSNGKNPDNGYFISDEQWDRAVYKR